MAQTLMIYNGTTDDHADAARTGGVPLAPAGFSWPLCAECGGPMQFFAHLPLEHGVLSVFLCQNDPGACETWDASSGSNRAFLFPRDGLVPRVVPARGVTLLPVVSAIRNEVVTTDDDTTAEPPEGTDHYDLARAAWQAEPGAQWGKQREVLGSLGGEPTYLEDDRIPQCPSCARPMDFAAHLEEGIDSRTAANLGGAVGYVFTCAGCAEAAFLLGS